MKLYEIKLTGYGNKLRFAGSEAAAKAVKREMLKEENLGPRSSAVTIVAIEVSTVKADLIDFLNGLVKS